MLVPVVLLPGVVGVGVVAAAGAMVEAEAAIGPAVG